jgi:hypothetical protein
MLWGYVSVVAQVVNFSFTAIEEPHWNVFSYARIVRPELAWFDERRMYREFKPVHDSVASGRSFAPNGCLRKVRRSDLVACVAVFVLVGPKLFDDSSRRKSPRVSDTPRGINLSMPT